MLRSEAQRQRFEGHHWKMVNGAWERVKWPESMDSEKGIYSFRAPGKEKPEEGEEESQASVVSRANWVAFNAQHHRAEQEKGRKIHAETSDKFLAKRLPLEENVYKNKAVRG